MRPDTLPFSTHDWNGNRYESTRSCWVMVAEKSWRVWVWPPSVVCSIELAA